MKRVIEGATFADAYQKALHTVYTDPEYVARPRGLGIKECLDFTMVINNPTAKMYINPVRSTPFRYMLAELCWYLSGERNVNWIKEFGSIWGKICNNDDTANSQYGYLTLYQRYADGISGYQYALECLKKDRDSRKAVMLYNQPKLAAVNTADTICTFSNQFMIRDNKLHMMTNMRSNDMIFGLPMDVVWFTKMQEQMFNDLKSYYPGLEMGKYYHTSASMHIYEHHWKLVDAMLKETFFPINFAPITSRMFMYWNSTLPVPNANEDFSYVRSWLDGKSTVDDITSRIKSREILAMMDLAEFFEREDYDPEDLRIGINNGDEDGRVRDMATTHAGWHMSDYDRPTDMEKYDGDEED